MPRHGNTPFLTGMFELPVTSFVLDETPTVGMNLLEDVTYLHIVMF